MLKTLDRLGWKWSSLLQSVPSVPKPPIQKAIQWPLRLFVGPTKPNSKGEREKEKQKFQHAPKSAAQGLCFFFFFYVSWS